MSAREVRVIRWIDSSLQNAQVHVSDAPLPEVITSVGFVVAEDSDGILLARDDHKDDEWRGLLAIPRCAVLTDDSLGDVLVDIHERNIGCARAERSRADDAETARARADMLGRRVIDPTDLCR